MSNIAFGARAAENDKSCSRMTQNQKDDPTTEGGRKKGGAYKSVGSPIAQRPPGCLNAKPSTRIQTRAVRSRAVKPCLYK